MIKIYIIFLGFLVPVFAFSQEGRTIISKSTVKLITYKKPVIAESTPFFFPKLQISNFMLNDENNNSVIDPGEKASFTFSVKNAGALQADEVIIKLSIINVPVGGPEYIVTRDTIGSILPDQINEITIALKGLSALNVSPLKFLIYAYEKTNPDAIPFEVEVEIGDKSPSHEINNESVKLKGTEIERIDTIKPSEIQPLKENVPDKP